MQTKSTYTNAGWDFTNVWTIATNDYPRLRTFECYTNSFERLSQGDPNWGNCGLGRPRSIIQTPIDTLTAMRSNPDKAVGLEDQDGKLLSGQSYMDSCNQSVQNQYKIRSKGCVLTSVTMVANALLREKYKPNTVNDWNIFANTPTHITNDIVWEKVADEITEKALSSCYMHKGMSFPKEQEKGDRIREIANILCLHNVPIAVRVLKTGQDGKTYGHTVIAYAVTGNSSGNPKILIKDPGYETRTSLDHYANIDYIDYIRPGSDCPHRISTQFRMNSPAELVITDSLGRKNGFDPRNEQTYSEIPDASYIVDWESDISVGDDPNLYIPGDRNEASKIATIYSLPGETFTVEIIGTGEGTGLFTQMNMAPGVTPQVAIEQTLSLSVESTETVSVKMPDPGDLDLDGDVDAEDLQRFAGYWMMSAPNLAADIYPPGGDGNVNLSDFAEFCQYWLTP